MASAKSQSRSKEILEYANRQGYASLLELCERFQVSSATMRRDVTNLAERGLVTRLHGAVKSKMDEQRQEPPYSERINMETEEKRRIAERALQEIHSGDSIILDSSTTVVELARLLAKSSLDITVITNDVEIAYILAPHPIIELICVGGYIRKGYYTSIGFFAESLWKELHADKLFMGVDAVNEEYGMMNYRIEEISCKKLMLKHSKQHYVLCDHTKFSASAVLQICPLPEVDLLITGSELDESFRRPLERSGLKLLYV